MFNSIMKSLLVFMASLSMLSVNAQLKDSAMLGSHQPQPSHINSLSKKCEMQIRTPEMAPETTVRNSGEFEVYYHRPAGAFCAVMWAENGVSAGTFQQSYWLMKPYTDYTFYGIADTEKYKIFRWDPDTESACVKSSLDLTVNYAPGGYSAPVFHAYQNTDDTLGAFFQHPGNINIWNPDTDPYVNPVVPGNWPTQMIVSSNDNGSENSMDFLLSSKYLNRRANPFPFMPSTGAEPYGDNSYGWWYGKNGFHDLDEPQCFVDGIAQAFEKPTAPYVLKQVVLDCDYLKVTDPVEMTCRVYKLDRIPDYNDTATVVLPEEPGELIAVGKAIVTPETGEETGGLIFFTLYCEEDGITYEITPEIDDAILVVIDGYNDAEMANLQDFTAEAFIDIDSDEGYGELAYLKYGVPMDDGKVNYHWVGLNNFFTSGQMKTAFTIFITAEMPYLAFYNNEEDGKYNFSTDGGLMEKTLGDHTCRSIEFRSSVPSADDVWYITCPEWLNIKLCDSESEGEFNGLVIAEVVAEPLTEGLYREAVVRFGFLGAYLDYKFTQGKKCGPGDGELDLGDLNYLIDLVLNEMYDNCYDVNGDGELNLADVNALIHLILSK